MVVVGISASGRNETFNEHGTLIKGVTEHLIKHILNKIDRETKYISLSNKVIRGCMGCLSCAKDNRCVLEDDWSEIRDAMFSADLIIFGFPNYYGTLNALAHSFLERFFSLRHRNVFELKNKRNVLVAIGTGNAEQQVKMFFRSNRMNEPLDVLHVSSGISQCYTCGYGCDCEAGSVVAKHGKLEKIDDGIIPCLPQNVYKEVNKIADKINNMQ